MKELANILLVDDNKMDVALTLDAFREIQFSNKIQVAHNGEEAIQHLLGEGKYADRETSPLPDIILLDLKMPGMDGFEVLKKIKKTPAIKRIPVIILTSSKEERDRARSYDYGANSYLLKPFSFTELLDFVRIITQYWLHINVEPPKN